MLVVELTSIVFLITACGAAAVKNLMGIVGGSISFSKPVNERAYLSFVPKDSVRSIIASVIESKLQIEEAIYTNRLHWNNLTGLFTITGLQKNDSGVYVIESKKGRVFLETYELKVFDPVPLPVVTTLNVSDDSCTLQCSVKKTEQMTLSWVSGEDILSRSSSDELSLTVNQRNLTSEYRCVAANPAEEKTLTVDLTSSCKRTDPQPSNLYVIIPIGLIILLILILQIYDFIGRLLERLMVVAINRSTFLLSYTMVFNPRQSRI